MQMLLASFPPIRSVLLRRIQNGMHRTLIERPIWDYLDYNDNYQCLQQFFSFLYNIKIFDMNFSPENFGKFLQK